MRISAVVEELAGDLAALGELGDEALAVAHKGGEHASGIDRAELGLVTDEDDLGPGRRSGALGGLGQRPS